MANENEIRSFLKNQYPHSNAWAKRVDRMSYEQALAIYLRFQGIEVAIKPEAPVVSPDQLTLF